ncbi:MAG TPA: DUF881 domain-containing protein [Planococcus sp. (in: firmicutes)]|nr:DUF881 domain-containing protein [Planococcus sp. (in: firmicutes)]
MKKKTFSRFTIILFLIGLMVGIQYNTINEPESRESHDIWELRQELSREKQLHSELLSEISALDETLVKYDNASSASPEQALKDTVQELRISAGLTDMTGPGIEITIEPSPEAMAFGYEIEGISPDLLIRFVNEINRFKGLHVSIDGQRLVNNTAIRDINGAVTVNARPVSTPPFAIKIISPSTEDNQKLYNHLLGSRLIDDFFIDNLNVAVQEPSEKLTIEAFDEALPVDFLNASEGE